MAAVVAQLRATPDVVTALGEDLTVEGGTKIWSEDMAFKADPPWLTYNEPGGDFGYFTRGTDGKIPYLDEGSFEISIVAPGTQQARLIGDLVVTSLNDAPLRFADGRLMYLRGRKPYFTPLNVVIPDFPVAYKRVIDFDYMAQRGQ